ncbi:uncharacterized protein LOC114239331 [Bombyx mandarina]|uniref:Metalloendopeptidase n=1 Tax=Bombyx mandarina TaxID=7092 RepID=A0A6J2J9L7_BOMMA|nr:uncharacterized protein LOC114239331 [Bombyx mandarina]
MEYFKLSVLSILFSVIKCLAMSPDELEDFKEFLTRTSTLDQNLRKGSDPEHDYDEDGSVSDHAWEESGKFEGDLILNDRQRRLIVENIMEGLSRNGVKDSTKRWPDNEVVYYIQREHFNGGQVQAIQEGIDDLAQASCVKFRPYKKGDRDAVVIQGSRRGCFSQVGYQGGYQVLNLSGRHPVGRGCFRHGTVVHELLHTLGFYHMQSSPDRDDYIDVVWENILEPARHNFRKYNSFAVSDFGVGYDYDSVLHYSRRAFSSNGQDTLVPKQSGADIGQRVGLSDKDKQKLNRMYCDADSEGLGELDESTEASIKKKKYKNKPFDGHGIGYHQGKAVVIKLLPTPATFKLVDAPTFHMFDYFSKTPQTLPATKTEGEHGTGKQITPSENYNDRNQKIFNIDSNKFINSQNINTDGLSSENLQEGFPEALHRLTKIVKSHVYPSQSSDNLFKVNEDYGELYIPPKYSSPKDLEVPTLKSNQNSAERFIENLYAHPKPHGTKTFYDDYTILPESVNKNIDQKEKNTNSKYPTIIHHEKQEQVKSIAKEYVSPEYASPESYQERPNYDTDNIHNNKKTIKASEFYAPFGINTHDHLLYQKKKYSSHPTRFDHDFYSNLPQNEKTQDEFPHYDEHNQNQDFKPTTRNSKHYSVLTVPLPSTQKQYQPTYNSYDA